MKTRFSTVDIVAVTNELQPLIGMRVNQVYDVDTKTYLLKLNRYEEKVTLLLESGIRIHTTEFEWPKSPAPSSFSMKLRKHIKNKRLEKLSQLGVDRVLDLQFGINEAAYHVILELYDRGNIVLTDYQYIILNILRPRTDNSDQDVKFVVRERYPLEMARKDENDLCETLQNVLNTAKAGENLRKILLSVTTYGPALIDHILLSQQFPKNACIGKNCDLSTDMFRLMAGIDEAKKILQTLSKGNCNGYIIQKVEKDVVDPEKKIITNLEFHPYLFHQFETSAFVMYPTFDKAADNFFSEMEAHKIESKTLQKEKGAMKKLENIKKDHEMRLNKLLQEQAEDICKAELIEINLELVEKAIMIIRSAVANQISWRDIWDLIQEAQAEGDPVAKVIKKLKLEINHFTILLSNPFESEPNNNKPMLVDIDLDLSAYGNARKYYDRKRLHAKKEQKTLEASEKAFKNAEKKTKQTLKEVAVISMITKARKPMWFEKFIWFISSENYLVIAGRDIQQNEVIVKRYMKPGDVYVHADIHGASSVVIKNPSKKEISPKTLSEAGTLAVCYSAAWDAKVLTSAWWVFSHQVSKTAPTGEYLSAGSFMIRGKKNYLLPSHLILGFGFLFKLADDSWERHKDERRIKQEDESEVASEVTEQSEDENIPIDNQDSSNEDEEEEDDSQPDQKGEMEHSVNEEEEKISFEDEEASEVSDDEGKFGFPDTKVHLEVLRRSLSHEESDITNNKTTVSDTCGTTLIIASNKKTKSRKTNIINKPKNVESSDGNVKERQNHAKRGQRSKLKKIKEKYKDQDEEERELKMKILASAGKAKIDKKKRKGKEGKVTVPTKSVGEISLMSSTDNIVLQKSAEELDRSETKEVHTQENDSDDEVDEDVEEEVVSEEMNLLTSLTGQPLLEDTLLYSIPVCAPYSSMQNYKYKVKVMPGTSRRGKAAKTALSIFLHDKAASQREKDCLRSVKDQDISRNFPGKVKLSYSSVKKK